MALPDRRGISTGAEIRDFFWLRVGLIACLCVHLDHKGDTTPSLLCCAAPNRSRGAVRGIHTLNCLDLAASPGSTLYLTKQQADQRRDGIQQPRGCTRTANRAARRNCYRKKLIPALARDRIPPKSLSPHRRIRDLNYSCIFQHLTPCMHVRQGALTINAHESNGPVLPM